MSLWPRVLVALICALGLMVSLPYSSPRWFEALYPFMSFVSWVIRAFRLDAALALFPTYPWAELVLFVAVTGAIVTGVTYVPGLVLQTSHAIWVLSRPYASSASFLIYCPLAGIPGAMAGVFLWTLSPYVRSTSFMTLSGVLGFIVFGWSVAILRCWAGRTFARSYRHGEHHAV